MAKKYYWMKLREDFFDDDTIEWLEEQPNGKEYSLFYLKLCLKSVKTNGMLIRNVGNIFVPYDTKKLSEITHTDYDTAVVAMEIFKNIGLVDILEGGQINIPRMEEMIGSETDKAAMMRKIRQQKKCLDGNNVTPMLPGESNNNISPNLPEESGNNVTTVLPECYRDVPAMLPEENGNIETTMFLGESGNNVTPMLPESSHNVTQRLENRDRYINNIIVEPPAQPCPGTQKPKCRIGEFEYKCVDILVASCKALFPNSKVPSTEAEREKWAVEIERMKRLDERNESDILEALTYATTDNFWKSNIRSTKKFREKFETLIIQSRGRVPRENQQAHNRFQNFSQRQYDYGELEQKILNAQWKGAGDEKV